MFWHPSNLLCPKETLQEKQEVKPEAAVRGNLSRAVLTSFGLSALPKPEESQN